MVNKEGTMIKYALPKIIQVTGYKNISYEKYQLFTKLHSVVSRKWSKR